jgi:replication factor C subunit 1
MLQELQMHTRLSAGVSKGSLALDYVQVLRDHIISPLVTHGAEGVVHAVDNMGEYSLLREDLDSLMEVTQWPDRPEPQRAVDSKTKAAFTRKYNKVGFALPYSIAMTSSKNKAGGEGEDMMPGDEKEVDDDTDEDINTVDASIKMKKAPKRRRNERLSLCKNKVRKN